MISAGKLRHRVNIQTVTRTRNATTGEFVDTWVNSATNIPCSIEPLSVSAYLQSKADQSEIKVRVVLRYRAGLDSTVRLVGACGCHSGRIYNPDGWLEDVESGREYVTAPCSEGVNEG